MQTVRLGIDPASRRAGGASPRLIAIAAIFVWISIATKTVSNVFPAINNAAETFAIGVGFFLYLGSTFKSRIRQTARISPLEVYGFLLVGLVPFAAWRANQVFGQHFFYGIAALRPFFLVFGCLYLYRSAKSGQIRAKEVRHALILYVVIWSIIFVGISEISPDSIISESEHLVATINDQTVLRFSYMPFALGIIFVRDLTNRRGTRLVISTVAYVLLFAALVVFLSKRSPLVALPIALAYSQYMKKGFASSVRWAFAVAFCAALVLLIYQAANLRIGQEYGQRFADAVAVVINQSEVTDVSASARVMELNRAYDYISSSPVLGNGQLSWQGTVTYETVFSYFYPSDIGIVGLVFVFGIAGTLLLCGQAIFAVRTGGVLENGDDVDSRVARCCLAGSLYLAVMSVMNGEMGFVPAASLTLLMIGRGFMERIVHYRVTS